MQRSFDTTASFPLREIHSLPFSSQKSLSLSEWPFTTGPFAKCLSPKQSSSNQCKQSGQMIFCNDLLNNSSQFTFLCPESPWGAIQAGGVLTAPLIELQTVITACQPFMSESVHLVFNVDSECLSPQPSLHIVI